MPAPFSANGPPDAAAGLEAVIIRAALDADFRQRLLTDAPTAIGETFGTVLPPTFRLRFIERDADVDLMIVLPDLVDADALDALALHQVIAGLAQGWTHLPWPREALQ